MYLLFYSGKDQIKNMQLFESWLWHEKLCKNNHFWCEHHQTVAALNNKPDKITNKKQIFVWWAFWDDKCWRIICFNAVLHGALFFCSLLIEKTTQNNKSESVSVQQRDVCLDQLLIWDNKQLLFKLTLNWKERKFRLFSSVRRKLCLYSSSFLHLILTC